MEVISVFFSGDLDRALVIIFLNFGVFFVVVVVVAFLMPDCNTQMC